MHPLRAFGLGLGLAAALAGTASPAQDEKAQRERPANPLETLTQLDSNGDMVVELEEVPEAGRAAFKRLLKRGDTNDNGKLEAEEMRGLLGRLRDLGGPAAERFRAMDKDGDGKVARDEFLGDTAIFDRLDADKDGFVDRREAGRGALGMAGPLLERLKRMDRDGDGKLTREEFTGPAPLFDRLDADQDGTISEAEARDFRPLDPPAGRPVAERKPEADPKPEMPPGSPPERLRRLRAMDTNDDKKISRDEFKGPEADFDRLDADGDGAISEDDLAKLRPTTRPDPPIGRPREAARGQRILTMDADQDGKVTRAEFKGPDRLFDRLDADKDGVITPAEARQAPDRREKAKASPEP